MSVNNNFIKNESQFHLLICITNFRPTNSNMFERLISERAIGSVALTYKIDILIFFGSVGSGLVYARVFISWPSRVAISCGIGEHFSWDKEG